MSMHLRGALRPEARRSRGLRHDQLRRIDRGDVRDLACRPLRRADERQAACQGVRLHPGEFRRQALLRDARSRRDDRRGGQGGAGAQGDRRRHDAVLQLHGGGRPRRHGRGRADRPGLAVLHLGHHRPAQGRHAHASQSAGDDAQLLCRRRPPAARRLDRACRADQPRLGPVELRHAGARLGPGLSRERQVRGARDGRADEPLARVQHLPRADHGEAADRAWQRVGAEARRAAADHLRRRADVCHRPQARARPSGQQAQPALRPGREPDDHHPSQPRDACRSQPSALGAAAGLGRAGRTPAST